MHGCKAATKVAPQSAAADESTNTPTHLVSTHRHPGTSAGSVCSKRLFSSVCTGLLRRGGMFCRHLGADTDELQRAVHHIHKAAVSSHAGSPGGCRAYSAEEVAEALCAVITNGLEVLPSVLGAWGYAKGSTTVPRPSAALYRYACSTCHPPILQLTGVYLCSRGQMCFDIFDF